MCLDLSKCQFHLCTNYDRNFLYLHAVIGVPIGLILLVLAVAVLAVMAGCVYLIKKGRIFKKCKTADTELNVTVSELLDDSVADSTAVVEITHPPNALVMPRRQYGQPGVNMQRDVADGSIDGVADGGYMRDQDVRPHLENLSTERYSASILENVDHP